MTHDECMTSNSSEAVRVRKILTEIKKIKIPGDLIMCKIIKEIDNANL